MNVSRFFLKSIEITAPFAPRVHTIIDIQLLTSIIRICVDLEAPAVFKPLYLTCFFSFLRFFNLLPCTVRTFDVTRQLVRCDLIITTNSALLNVKRSAQQNYPLFIFHRNTYCVPLTDSAARKHLKLVSNILQLSPPLTFHAFRRDGASWAFQNGIPLEFIKKHGTWKSVASHTYLTSTPSFTPPVSLAFSTFLYL